VVALQLMFGWRACCGHGMPPWCDPQPCVCAPAEHIGLAMSITSSCILLGGRPFLAQYGAVLAAALTAYVGDVRERGMLLLFPVMDLLLVQYPQEGAQLLGPALQVGSDVHGGGRCLARRVCGTHANMSVSAWPARR